METIEVNGSFSIAMLEYQRVINIIEPTKKGDVYQPQWGYIKDMMGIYRDITGYIYIYALSLAGFGCACVIFK